MAFKRLQDKEAMIKEAAEIKKRVALKREQRLQAKAARKRAENAQKQLKNAVCSITVSHNTFDDPNPFGGPPPPPGRKWFYLVFRVQQHQGLAIEPDVIIEFLHGSFSAPFQPMRSRVDGTWSHEVRARILRLMSQHIFSAYFNLSGGV